MGRKFWIFCSVLVIVSTWSMGQMVYAQEYAIWDNISPTTFTVPATGGTINFTNFHFHWHAHGYPRTCACACLYDGNNNVVDQTNGYQSFACLGTDGDWDSNYNSTYPRGVSIPAGTGTVHLYWICGLVNPPDTPDEVLTDHRGNIDTWQITINYQSGSPCALSFSCPTTDFGQIQNGQCSTTYTGTLSNSGDVAAPAGTITSSNSQLQIVSGANFSSIPAHGSITFTYRVCVNQIGQQNGNFSTTVCGGATSPTITWDGVSAPSCNYVPAQSSLTITAQQGHSNTAVDNIHNNGNAGGSGQPTIDGTNAGAFSGSQLPNIPAGDNADWTVTFMAPGVGDYYATAHLPCGGQTISLHGIGTQQNNYYDIGLLRISAGQMQQNGNTVTFDGTIELNRQLLGAPVHFYNAHAVANLQAGTINVTTFSTGDALMFGGQGSVTAMSQVIIDAQAGTVEIHGSYAYSDLATAAGTITFNLPNVSLAAHVQFTCLGMNDLGNVDFTAGMNAEQVGFNFSLSGGIDLGPQLHVTLLQGNLACEYIHHTDEEYFNFQCNADAASVSFADGGANYSLAGVNIASFKIYLNPDPVKLLLTDDWGLEIEVAGIEGGIDFLQGSWFRENWGVLQTDLTASVGISASDQLSVSAAQVHVAFDTQAGTLLLSPQVGQITVGEPPYVYHLQGVQLLFSYGPGAVFHFEGNLNKGYQEGLMPELFSNVNATLNLNQGCLVLGNQEGIQCGWLLIQGTGSNSICGDGLASNGTVTLVAPGINLDFGTAWEVPWSLIPAVAQATSNFSIGGYQVIAEQATLTLYNGYVDLTFTIAGQPITYRFYPGGRLDDLDVYSVPISSGWAAPFRGASRVILQSPTNPNDWLDWTYGNDINRSGADGIDAVITYDSTTHLDAIGFRNYGSNISDWELVAYNILPTAGTWISTNNGSNATYYAYPTQIGPCDSSRLNLSSHTLITYNAGQSNTIEPTAATTLNIVASALSILRQGGERVQNGYRMYIGLSGSANGEFRYSTQPDTTIDSLWSIVATGSGTFHDVTLNNLPSNAFYYFKGVSADSQVVRSNICHATGALSTPQPSSLLPKEFILHQNFPNPFNPSTEIRFDLPKTAEVSLTVYNVLGREVEILVNSTFPAGYHSVVWNGTDRNGLAVPSGLYFIRLQSPQFGTPRVMKAMLLK